MQGQVVAAVEPGALVQLIPAADQRQVATGVDLAADVLDVGDFVTLGFLAAPTALLFLVVQGVIAVLGGEQLQVAAGDQVGFLAGGDGAGDQREVLAGAEGDVAAGVEAGADLADVVFLGFDFVGFAVAVVFVGGGSQGEVIAGVEGEVALGVQLAGDDGEVVAGVDGQVAACFEAGAVLGDGEVAVFAAVFVAVQLCGRAEGDVAAGADAGVAAALQDAAEVVEVAACGDGQVVGGFDACGVVDEVAVLGVEAVAAVVAGDGAFVADVAGEAGQADVAALDDAAGLVGEVVAGQQVEAIAGLHQAAVDQVIASHGGEVAGGLEGAGVTEVVPGDQADVLALDQRAIGGQAVVGLGQVQHRDHDWLAVDDRVFQPDDVVGQGRYLLGGEADAQRQHQRVLAGDGVVHQVAEHVFVGGQAVEIALAGVCDHGLLDQLLLVEAVAQALGAVVGVVAELAEQVVRAHELLEVGECRVGFDQVFMRLGLPGVAGQALDLGHTDRASQVAGRVGADVAPLGTGYGLLPLGRADAGLAEVPAVRAGVALGTALATEAEQAVLPGGQFEPWQRQWVDLLLCQVRGQLLVEGHAGGKCVARGAGVGARATADVLEAGTHHAVVEVVLGGDVDVAAGLDDRGVALVTGAQLRHATKLRQFGFGGADELAHGRRQAAEVAGVVAVAVQPVTVGERLGHVDPAAAIAGALGTKHAHGFGIGGLHAGVGEVVQRGAQVAAGGDGAAVVEQVAAVKNQVATGGDARCGTGGGDLQFFALHDLPDAVLLAAAVAGVDAFDAGDLFDFGGVDALVRDRQQRTDVFDGAGGQAHAAVALHQAGAVDDAGGPTTVAVTVDVQVAQAVEAGVAVGERCNAQAHVPATEDQAVIIEQRCRGEGEVLAAAQGAVVVHGACVQHQVGAGGQATVVVQHAGDADQAVAAAGDARHVRQVQLPGAQGQVTPAAQATLAGVEAAQAQVQAAIAGDQAVVAPVHAGADQAVGGQQLAAGALGEVVDVDAQAPGLDDAAVGPLVGREGQAAPGDEVAAGIDDVGGGDVEGAVADVQHGAAGVEEAAQAQAQVGVGAFQGAVAVVQQARDLQTAGALGTEGAQLTVLVVQVGGGDVEGAVALEDALGITQGTGQAEVDLLTDDLPCAVVQVGAVDAEALCGVKPATAVIEVAGVEKHLARLSGKAPALVVDTGRRQVQALGLGGAALAADQVDAVLQPTAEGGGQCGVQAGQDAAAVIEVAGVEVEVTVLGEDTTLLVVDITGDVQGQHALALQGALVVAQACGLQLHIAVLAVDQAVGVVLHYARGGQRQQVVGGDCATLAVVQTARQESEQPLAGELAALVIDLAGAQAQRPGAGEFALGIGQGAEQVEGDGVVADQAGAAVIQRVGGDAQGLRGTDGAAAVVEGRSLDGQDSTAVDLAALAVVQLSVDGQCLSGGAGEYSAVAVVEAAGVDRQVVLTDQGAGIAVEQGVFDGYFKVTVAAGERAVIAVVQVIGVDDQPFPAGNEAVLVVHTKAVERQVLAADQLAVVVIEVAAGECKALLAGDFAALVVQVAQVVDVQRTGGGDQATGVVQVAARRAEIQGDGAAQQRSAVLVVQRGGLDIEALGGVDQAVSLVVQQAVDGQVQGVAAGQGAALVVEAGGAHVEGRRGDQAFEVAQRLLHAHGQCLAAQQFAVAVVQAVGGEDKGLGTGDFPALVVHFVEVAEHQQRCADQAVAVVQLAVIEVQVQRAVTEQQAALLVQAGDVGGQSLVAGDAAGVLVGHLGGRQLEGIAAGQVPALAVIERARAETHRALATDVAALAVIQAGAVQTEAGVGDQLTALVIDHTQAVQAEWTGTGQAALAIVQAGGAHRQCAFAVDRTAEVGQGTVEADIHCRQGTDRPAAVVQGLAGQ